MGGRYRVLRDRALTRYVALVGNAVAAHSDRPDLRYYFAVLDADEVNAFAAPGGFVFVTRGALRLMRDEAALGGVLGHEIAHVALRHGVDAIKAQKQKELAVFGLREGLAQSRAAAFTSVIASTTDFFVEQIVLKGSMDELKMVAESLVARSSLRLRIEGHTDSTGDPRRNVALSRRRAEAVKSALVQSFGISPERLTTGGLGATRPLGPNDTPEGRARNRRVEFVRQ